MLMEDKFMHPAYWVVLAALAAAKAFWDYQAEREKSRRNEEGTAQA